MKKITKVFGLLLAAGAGLSLASCAPNDNAKLAATYIKEHSSESDHKYFKVNFMNDIKYEDEKMEYNFSNGKGEYEYSDNLTVKFTVKFNDKNVYDPLKDIEYKFSGDDKEKEAIRVLAKTALNAKLALIYATVNGAAKLQEAQNNSTSK